jgi:hypothetical protein
MGQIDFNYSSGCLFLLFSAFDHLNLTFSQSVLRCLADYLNSLVESVPELDRGQLATFQAEIAELEQQALALAGGGSGGAVGSGAAGSAVSGSATGVGGVAALAESSLEFWMAKERRIATRESITQAPAHKDFSPLVAVLDTVMRKKQIGDPASIAALAALGSTPTAAMAAAAAVAASSSSSSSSTSGHKRSSHEISSSSSSSSSSVKAAKVAGAAPIIIVPSALTSVITLHNAFSILSKGLFLPSVATGAASAAGAQQQSLFIERASFLDESKTVKFEVVDSTAHFKPDDWDRVVAVFVTGQAWQFQSWKWTEPTALFSNGARNVPSCVLQLLLPLVVVIAAACRNWALICISS